MKLTLPRKILLNNAFYLLPITVLLYLMYSGFSKDINFAEKEIVGADINKTAITLLQKTVSGAADDAETKAEWTLLLEKKKRYNDVLKFDDSILKAKGKNNLVSSTFADTINDATSGKMKKELVFNSLNDLIAYVGDSSNLILDPDLDTYYLMDATIYAVPQLVNRLNEVNHLLSSKSSNLTTLTPIEQMKLNSYIEIIKNIDSTRLKGDLDTSLKEDKNFFGENKLLQTSVKADLVALDNSLNAYLAILSRINLAEIVSPEEMNTSFKKVSSDLLTVEGKSIDSLAEMLQARVDAIKASRLKAMGTGTFAVMLALFISFLITKSVKSELNTLIARLSENSLEVENTSKQNMDISTELSSAVTEQSTSVQEISATTEEISQMTQKNNDNIKTTMHATSKTKETASTANELMEQLGETIKDLKKGNEQIFERSNLNSKNFESIISIMKTIEDKTKVINDIVFQTKLLSFNASVEAARAGEQGKGFSVVADEVGKLAQMSGNAAQEITELLDSSLKKVRELTVEADFEIKKVVESSSANISVVVTKVGHCQNINSEILHNSEKITNLINEVVQASEEQTKGVMEITKAIGTFDIVTDRNSQLANSLNESSISLSDKSVELREVINSLAKMVGSSTV